MRLWTPSAAATLRCGPRARLPTDAGWGSPTTMSPAPSCCARWSGGPARSHGRAGRPGVMVGRAGPESGKESRRTLGEESGQPFVPPVAAGVAFSADPRTGRRDRIVLNATRGLGEALVGGHL